jgi:O-antigen ligase/Flp pilus assembly protein TadD
VERASKQGVLALLALALAPLFVLAWPGSLGPIGQLQPELFGAGLLSLGAMAAALTVALLRRPVALSGLTLLLGFVALGVLAQRSNAPGDTLEASRSMLLCLSALALLIVGARLDHAGRAVLVRAAILLSIAFVVPALMGVQGRLFGSLGNTGSTAQAALPGALAGAVLLAGGRGAWRALGFAAVVPFAAYVTLAPSITAAIALVVTLSIGILRSRRLRLGLAVTLATCAVSGQVARWIDSLPESTSSRSATESEQARSASTGSQLGGVAVRRRVWTRSLDMLGDHLWLGTGPGQFRATFPPYRDPLERERSDRASGFETEVEHAHNDWLQGVLDGGLLGGALWIAFLLVCARGAWRSLGDGPDENADNDLAALGAGVLGVLVGALAHSPLLFNPASAGLFFLFAGTLLARPAEALAPSRARTLMPLFAAMLLAVQAPRALAFLRYGDQMRLVPTGRGDEKRLPDRDRVERALVQCPDSTLALRMLARDPATAQPAAFWERLLQLRPDSFEALVQLGGLRANAGRAADARALWLRAHELQPERESALRNLALLEARAGNAQASGAWLERLQHEEPGRPTSDHDSWLRETAAGELLRGREGSARILFERFDPGRLDGPAEKVYAEAQGMRESSAPLDEGIADGLECLAHTLWAREHASAGRFADAVRSYRQALRLSSILRAGGAPRLRLEYAAALLRDGQEDKARSEVEAAAALPADWVGLPEGAGEALLEAALLGAH